jgi:hypothetical protein
MSNRRGRRRQGIGSTHPSPPQSQPSPTAHVPPVRETAIASHSGSEENALATVRLTRWLVVWTAVLALVGIVTAGVGIVQWKALLKTDSTTREAFTAVQRPFIVATGLEAVQDLPLFWSFRTILENTGSTPTKNMTVISAVSFSVPVVPNSPMDPMELRGRSTDAYPTITDHFVGPHGKAGIEAISLIAQTLEEMAERRADFYVYGMAVYNDQFAATQDRLTKFCFVVRPFKGSNGLSLNNRGLCHHWNCGDEDCERDKRKYEIDRQAVLTQNPNAKEISQPIPLAAIIPSFPVPLIKAQ